jgi:hypothetical protein
MLLRVYSKHQDRTLILEMQVTDFLEALEFIWAYQTTRRHISLYRNLVLLGIQRAQ